MHFENDVILRSQEIPVVVDFWAPWCGPCRFLGPLIEQLAEEDAGRWELVKLNVDEYPEISQRFGIRGIPNVKMFIKGEVVAEFAGALPKMAIKQWLDDHIPSACKDGYDELLSTLKPMPDSENIVRLEEYTTRCPEMTEARILLAKHLLFSEPSNALDLVSDYDISTPMYDDVVDIRTLGEFLQMNQPADTEIALLMSKIRGDLISGRFEDAAIAFIEAINLDRTFNDELPRRAAIAFFKIIGNEHTVSQVYRRRFDMALY